MCVCVQNEALEFTVPDLPTLLYYVRTGGQQSVPFGAPALDVNILLKSLRNLPPPTPSLLVPLTLPDLDSLRNSLIGISAEYDLISTVSSLVLLSSSFFKNLLLFVLSEFINLIYRPALCFLSILNFDLILIKKHHYRVGNLIWDGTFISGVCTFILEILLFLIF